MFPHDAVTVTYDGISAPLFLGAEPGSRWPAAQLSLQNLSWACIVKPSEGGRAEVWLALLEPDCIASVEQLSVRFTGLGTAFDGESLMPRLLFSTKLPSMPGTMTAAVVYRFAHHTLVNSKPKEKKAFFPGGQMHITFRMRIAAGQPWTQSVARALVPAAPTQSLAAQIGALRFAGADAAVPSDVTFVFKGAHEGAPPLTAHVFMLALASDYFKALFFGPTAPAGGGPYTLEVHDVSPTGLQHLLEFAYSGAPEQYSLATAAEVLVAADFYNMPRLLSQCDHVLASQLSAQTALDTLELAHARRRDALCAAALRCAAASVRQLIGTPRWAQLDAPLRDAITLTALNHGEPAAIAQPPSRARPAEEPTADDDGAKRARSS